MALEDYSKYFMYGGIVLLVAVTAFFYYLEKQDKTDVVGIKSYLSKDRWQGEVVNSKIESWQQLNARYGNDFFYEITFYLPGDPNIHTSKALVAPGQMHLIKKGLDIQVKVGKKGEMAIIGINFNK
ncbi:hypothetical protein SAMN05192562_1178 [Kosakonia arachidis]|uniref:Uncharacterized protein n=1 Tax=Kosakonia arachidis TaxID=551989 RepID=A0A1I7EBV2_9ENTR|nr:hypothetical protein [Kosakonia arachidis]SFU21408.1 hypothetical protein SAMN05192562_1178 [Kosakonia arachidis]